MSGRQTGNEYGSRARKPGRPIKEAPVMESELNGVFRASEPARRRLAGVLCKHSRAVNRLWADRGRLLTMIRGSFRAKTTTAQFGCKLVSVIILLYIGALERPRPDCGEIRAARNAPLFGTPVRPWRQLDRNRLAGNNL